MSLTAAIFLLGFVAGCILALVRNPIYGLTTYVAVFYLHPPSRWWGQVLPDLRWSLIAAGVTLLAVLIAKRPGHSIPLFRYRVMVGLIVFLAWLGLQTFWALDLETHMELLTIFAKYALLVALIYKCVNSEENLRLFLWTHVLGCAYLGWIVFTTYDGGRFEGFGGPDINEANSGALQIVTGMLVAASLFLAGKLREKAMLFGCLPFIVNALVATLSRSGFLAAGAGGIMFNFFAPAKFRKRVVVLSVLGAVLFMLLTNPLYWTRIGSIQYAGEEVAGVDTGAGRLTLIEAQWRMFKEYPFGCGHRCTAVLSPDFLDDSALTGTGENRARSSHNTAMTMLVEQGIPGLVLYLMLLIWIFRAIRTVRRRLHHQVGFLPTLFPAIASILGAITLGDLFVDYLKLEVRLWFIGILTALLSMTENSKPAPEAARSVGASSSSRLPPMRKQR